MKHILWISSCASRDQGGGIYAYTLSDDGIFAQIELLPVDLPMYSVLAGTDLYVLQRELSGGESGVFRVAVRADGTFGTPSEAVTTHGVVACHLTVEQGEVYAVNYLSGSVVRIPDRVVSYEGHGIHPDRQEASHTHCVILSPDRRYVLVADLGLDCVHVLDRELNEISRASVPAGSGARHLVFSPDGTTLFCVNELSSTVSVFAWEPSRGRLTYRESFGSDVSPEFAPMNYAAAIRISHDGKKLYISNRGEDTVVVYSVGENGRLSLVQKVSCRGRGPRDFQLSPDERFLVCTNLDSDSVTAFRLRDGMIDSVTDSIRLPSPLCVTFSDPKRST